MMAGTSDSPVNIVEKFKHFSSFSYEEKLGVKADGRPLPNLDISFQAVSRGKPISQFAGI